MNAHFDRLARELIEEAFIVIALSRIPRHTCKARKHKASAACSKALASTRRSWAKMVHCVSQSPKDRLMSSRSRRLDWICMAARIAAPPKAVRHTRMAAARCCLRDSSRCSTISCRIVHAASADVDFRAHAVQAAITRRRSSALLPSIRKLVRLRRTLACIRISCNASDAAEHLKRAAPRSSMSAADVLLAVMRHQ